MHASDTIIHLVADGYALDPQPWLKNDLIIVGPQDDPAGIRGMTDGVQALAKIIEAKANFVVHQSLGAQEVLRDLTRAGNLTFDPAHALVDLNDHERQVLRFAAQTHAYTMVGRIPFRSGKMPNDSLVLMVEGDPRMRRPYLVVVADPARFPDAHYLQAKRLAEYLREPATQEWIAEFGRGVLDDRPIFFAVHPAAP